MKKIGLFYATKADKTTWVAEKIQKEFGKDKLEVVAIEQAWQNDFTAYDCFIVGASTWFDGELPTYWDELLPELRTLNLKGKKVAIFGLGDQIRYPENFADCCARYVHRYYKFRRTCLYGKSGQWLYSGPKHTTNRERFGRRRKSVCSFRSAHWR